MPLKIKYNSFSIPYEHQEELSSVLGEFFWLSV